MSTRTFKDWVIAVRPWSFPASVIPVLTSLGYLYFLSKNQSGETFDWVNGWLTFPMLMILHAGGNLVSDYFDHIKGVDLPGSLNGVRHIQSGKFQPKTILHYGWTLLFIGALLGLVILWRSSWEAVWIGVAALALPLLYPWMKSHALGDLDILLCFAMLPSIGVGYVVTGHYHWEMLFYCLSYGLLTVSILHANNTRDIENDRRAGLHTLCGLIGSRASQYLYLVLLALPYTIVILLVVLGIWPLWSLLVLITLPLAWKNVRLMFSVNPVQEQDIPTLDKQSAQLQMTFGLLLALSFVI